MRFASALIAALLATAVMTTPALAQQASGTAQVQLVGPSLDAVLADHRRDGDRDRDGWRHPADTLAFFKVHPGQTVVDVMPGGGWYTRILAPLLAGNGRYIALNPDVRGANETARKYLAGLGATFPAQAAVWTGQPAASILAYNTDGLPASLDGTVDRLLIFREMHNLHRWGLMHNELTAYRRLLKPDGLLGIEQHRAPRTAPASYTDGSKGYMREKDIIALMDLYGFELIAQSDVNANPKDPANHPQGVWELPPNLRTKREELKAVGESDRMTLLFRKRP